MGILDDILAQNADIGAGSREIASILGLSEASSRESASDIERASSLNSDITNLRGQEVIKAENSIAAARNLLSNKPEDPESMYSIMAQDLLAGVTEARALAPQVKELQSKDFFQSPLGYIAAQFQLPSVVSQYNAAADKANLAANVIQELDERLTSSAAAQRAAARTVTVDMLAKQREVDAIKAKLDADKLRREGFGSRVEEIKVLMSGSQSQITNLIAYHNIQNADKQLDLAMEARADAHARLDKDKSHLEYIAMEANAGRKLEGLPELSPAVVEYTYLHGTAPDKAKMDAWRVNGSTALATGKYQIADSPGEAALTMMVNKSPMPPETRQVRDFLVENGQRIYEEMVAANGGKPPKREAVEAQVNAWLKGTKERRGKIAEMKANVESSPDNLYRLPPMDVMAKIPAVAETPTFKVLIGPFLAAGKTDVDFEQVVTSARDAIRAGTLPSFNNVVIDLSSMYRAGVAYNNAVKDFNRFQLDNQTDYKVRAKGAGRLFGSGIIDATDEQQLGSYLYRRLLSELTQDPDVTISKEGIQTIFARKFLRDSTMKVIGGEIK